MSEHRSLTVPEGAAGSRVDRFVADATGLSRAHVQRLIAEGLLTVDGQRLRARDPVRAGWHLELEVPEAASDEPLPEDIPLTVVYRDDDVLVVDKPAGLVTHPAPGHRSGTLVNALLGLAAAEAIRFGAAIDETAIDESDPEVEAGTDEVGEGVGGATERAGIVHRLDRDTSGLLMVARNPAAHVALQAQLKARRVRKTYLGLVGGVVNAQLGRIEKPIGRDPRTRLRMAVTAEGRPAVTGYRVRERFGEWTLLELDLVTGRTHQIRVHLASIGHAVAGDPVYATGVTRRGPDGLTRLFLHAWKLEFVSPGSGRLVRCEAPLPDDLEGALESLRAAASGRA
ncbi:MAG TPA: RluA family pseudouridine synthase [Candidatus Deferrimicrobium sp.]|nr:RluA family pseudouridine synthase [Candidatus Deferrimicrobium sp.]